MAHENYGHRARVRARMMKEGLDGFQDHEVLEFLLFQYLPYKDTNKIAHNLLNKFGGFSGVLDADPKQLMTVDGISEVTACNISMLKEVLVRYRRSQADRINLGSVGSIVQYANKLVIDNYAEKLIVVYVDHATNYRYADEFSSNRLDKVNIDVKQIVSSAMRINAAGVMLFHCHVKGGCKPSEADVALTKRLIAALAPIDIVLLEHIIFNSDSDYYSFFAEGLLDKLVAEYNKLR